MWCNHWMVILLTKKLLSRQSSSISAKAVYILKRAMTLNRVLRYSWRWKWFHRVISIFWIMSTRDRCHWVKSNGASIYQEAINLIMELVWDILGNLWCTAINWWAFKSASISLSRRTENLNAESHQNAALCRSSTGDFERWTAQP